MDRPVPQLSLKERREQTIARLCQHFAEDRLEMGEFESRLDHAHRATTPAELDRLLHDLTTTTPTPTAQEKAREALARGSRAMAEAVRESRTLVAIMAGVERRGQWQPARRNIVIAVMGGAELDFRDVIMPAGVVEVSIFCMMGGVEIIVPPTLAVDASGFAIMGGFEHGTTRPVGDPNAPVLRVTGFAFMGAVEIHERLPGESARDARTRRRDERRMLRDERRRLRDQ